MCYTLWNSESMVSPPKEVRPRRMVIISWVSNMIYDRLWSISEKSKPELLVLKPILLRIHFLFSKLCHPLSQWKWALVWKRLGPQARYTPSRWHTTALARICGRKEARTLPLPLLLSQSCYWRHLLPSFNILSLLLVFLENTRTVTITKLGWD